MRRKKKAGWGYPDVPMSDVLMMKMNIGRIEAKSERDPSDPNGKFNASVRSGEGENLIVWSTTPYDFTTQEEAIQSGNDLIMHAAEFDPTSMDVFEAVLGLLHELDDEDDDPGCGTCDQKDYPGREAGGTIVRAGNAEVGRA